MSETRTQAPQRVPMPRWSLAFLSAVHAAIFGFAASVLPWKAWTLFAAICAALALLHAATGLLAALRHGSLARAWRVQALASLTFLVYVAWGMLSSAWTLRTVYDGLGDGLAGAIVAVVGLVVMVTLPLAWWGLAMTGGVRWRWGASSATVVLVAGLAIAQLTFIQREAEGQVILDEAGIEAVQKAVETALAPIAAEHTRKRPQSLMTRDAARCPEPPSDAHLTMLVTYFPRTRGARRAVSACLQGPGVERLQTQLARIALTEARKGYIKVEVVVRQHALPAEADFMASMAIRPGIDGVCRGGACLAPWQLVGARIFDGFMPFEAVPSARLGASFERLGRSLGRDASGDMIRIETRGWLLNRHGEIQATGRTGARVEVTPQIVRKATLRSQRYIVWSQLDNGRFRYIVNPYSGRSVSEPFSIPRQAGTTLALCEVGDSLPKVIEAINASLDHLASLEKRFEGESRGVLHRASDDPQGPLVIGGSTLSLAALMRCRARIGDRHDAFIGRLARMILGQQRPDGGFHHTIDGATGLPLGDKPNKLYIDGQAILGLVLLEAVAGEEEGTFPSRETLRAAVDRAMAFTTGDYWSHFMGQFFSEHSAGSCQPRFDRGDRQFKDVADLLVGQ